MLYLPFLKEKKKASGIHKPVSPIAIPGHTREQILKKNSNYSDDKKIVKDSIRLK